jgi:hypothetical protein
MLLLVYLYPKMRTHPTYRLLNYTLASRGQLIFFILRAATRIDGHLHSLLFPSVLCLKVTMIFPLNLPLPEFDGCAFILYFTVSCEL